MSANQQPVELPDDLKSALAQMPTETNQSQALPDDLKQALSGFNEPSGSQQSLGQKFDDSIIKALTLGAKKEDPVGIYHGLKHGALQVAKGIANITNEKDPYQYSQDELARYEALKKQHPNGTKLGEILGSAAPFAIGEAFLPELGAGFGANLTKNVALGAGQGEILSAGEGDNPFEGAAVGGSISGAFGALGGLINKGAGAVANQLSSVVKNPKSAQQLLDLADKHGFNLGTLDIASPKSELGGLVKSLASKLPYTGIGNNQVINDEARNTLANDIGNKFSGNHNKVIESLARKKNEVQQMAGATRDDILERLGNKSLPKDLQSVDAIDSEIGRLSKLPSGGDRATKNTGLINKLKKYKKDILSGNDLNTLTDLRTTLRDDVRPEFGQSGTREQGAQKRIYGAMTSDIDNAIKGHSPQDLAHWQEANHIFFDEAQKVKNPKIRDLMNANKAFEGSISKEQVERGVLGDSKARAQLYDSLDDEGRQHAKGVLINKFMENAHSSGKFSVNNFLGQLNRNRDKLRTWFKGDDAKELDGAIKLMNATKDAQGAADVPKTGYQNVVFHMASVLGGAFAPKTAALGGTAILAARLYNSASVRDSLIDLAKFPADSTQFKLSATRLLNHMNRFTVSQATRDDAPKGGAQ